MVTQMSHPPACTWSRASPHLATWPTWPGGSWKRKQGFPFSSQEMKSDSPSHPTLSLSHHHVAMAFGRQITRLVISRGWWKSRGEEKIEAKDIFLIWVILGSQDSLPSAHPWAWLPRWFSLTPVVMKAPPSHCSHLSETLFTFQKGVRVHLKLRSIFWIKSCVFQLGVWDTGCCAQDNT